MTEIQPRAYDRTVGRAGAAIDAGLRAYMLRVYNYMAAGLAITGVVAYFAATTGLYASIAATPLIWVVMLAPLGMVFLLSALAATFFSLVDLLIRTGLNYIIGA